MIEHQPSSSSTHAKMKKVSLQEQSVRVGDVVVVNGYRVSRMVL